ncbi:MAG: NAD(P)/FAD-dependent oxidoreductase [Candidatus Melainabacteria bacterium]|nr:NAD(P)/FAD-dependent oxidoreductase [Candidatus Melainabacteria bacterium]
MDNTEKIHDVIIIGGGPAGLMTAFYCGTGGMKPMILEALDFLGGQSAALYPEKPVYDVPGIIECTGQELSDSLTEQVMQIEPYVEFNQSVDEIKQIDGVWGLFCKSGKIYKTKAVVIATGKGAFAPIKLGIPGEDDYLGKGLTYTVKHIADYKGKDILIVGGGDSAMDWTCTLKDVAKSVTLIHRRDGFKAHIGAVNQIKAMAEAKEINMFIPYEIKKIEGKDKEGKNKVEKVTIFNNQTNEEKTFPAQSIIICAGFKPTVDALKKWGVELNEKGLIKTHDICKTNLTGIFAVGDATEYIGKRHLIVMEFGEAASAAGAVSTHIYGKGKGGAEWWAGPKKKKTGNVEVDKDDDANKQPVGAK